MGIFDKQQMQNAEGAVEVYASTAAWCPGTCSSTQRMHATCIARAAGRGNTTTGSSYPLKKWMKFFKEARKLGDDRYPDDPAASPSSGKRDILRLAQKHNRLFFWHIHKRNAAGRALCPPHGGIGQRPSAFVSIEGFREDTRFQARAKGLTIKSSKP